MRSASSAKTMDIARGSCLFQAFTNSLIRLRIASSFDVLAVGVITSPLLGWTDYVMWDGPAGSSVSIFFFAPKVLWVQQYCVWLRRVTRYGLVDADGPIHIGGFDD